MQTLIFAVILLLALFMVPLGLPGTWIMLAAAVGLNAIVGHTIIGDPIGWVPIIGTLTLAVIGEVFEFTIAARYTKKYGGSRRAGWGAILGGIVGAIVGVPVPVVGSVIGAFVGSFIGALVLEYSREANHRTATRVAWGALIGRVFATAAKTGIGVAMAVWLIWAALI
jgi:uncharacterized protein YqgC (DUF456 family)